jgi:hypothetical protein
MDIFFLFLPAAIVLGNYLFSDLREDPTPARAKVQPAAASLAPCEAC